MADSPRIPPSLYIDALVSGRSRQRREEALLVFLSQGFIDESGVGEDTPTFVLGGYYGGVEMWKSFSNDWQSVLDQTPVDTFHMFKCEGGRDGGFEMMDSNERTALCLELVQVIADHKPVCATIEMDTVSFRELVRDRLKKRRKITGALMGSLAYQYGYAASALIVKALESLEEHSGVQLGRIEMIFDWQQQHHAKVQGMVDYQIVPWMQESAPEMYRRFGGTKWPREKERDMYVPLQAADLLVWHRRRWHDHPDGKDRPVWKALERASMPFKGYVSREFLQADLERGVLPLLLAMWGNEDREP